MGAENAFFDELPLVLTASRLAQSPLDAPAAVTVIDREMIEASGFTEVHDLLRLVPGFLVADHPEGVPTIANHGLGDAHGRRIKVMIDGRTINSPLWGDVLWQHLPIRVDDIDRVEVVRGPNGAAYGVDAFQGVVNIITRAPATEDGTRVIARAGRNGFYDYGVRVNAEPGGAIDWRLSASRRAQTTFEPQLQVSKNIRHPGEDFRQDVANFTATSRVTDRDDIGLNLAASQGASGRGSVDYPDSPPHREDDRSLYLHLSWQHTIDAESSFTLRYYHQSENARGDWIYTQVAHDGQRYAMPTDRNSDTQRDDLEAQFVTRLTPSLRAMVGAGVRAERVRSERLFDTRDTLRADYAQVFGSLTWRATPELSVDLGGTFEQHDYSGNIFSPRLALNYAIDADSTVRMAAGEAFRAPSLMESRAMGTVREDGILRRIWYRVMGPLETERMRYADLGYVAHFRQLGLSVDARLFRESYNRFIDDNTCRTYAASHDFASMSPSALAEVCSFNEAADFQPYRSGEKSFFFMNASSFVIDGVELAMDWRWRDWGRLVASQAYTKIRPRGSMSDPDIPESAPHALTSVLFIKQLPQRWQASVGYYHSDSFYWMNGGDVVPTRGRVDLKLSRRFGPPSANNEFAITAQSVRGGYREFHEGKFRAEPQLFATLQLGF